MFYDHSRCLEEGSNLRLAQSWTLMRSSLRLAAFNHTMIVFPQTGQSHYHFASASVLLQSVSWLPQVPKHMSFIDRALLIAEIRQTLKSAIICFFATNNMCYVTWFVSLWWLCCFSDEIQRFHCCSTKAPWCPFIQLDIKQPELRKGGTHGVRSCSNHTFIALFTIYNRIFQVVPNNPRFI